MRAHRDRTSTPLAGLALLLLCLLCILSILCILCLASPASAASSAGAAQYEIDATVSLESRSVVGTVSIVFTNHSDTTLRDAVIFLFPNRFSTQHGLTDLARPFVYPEEEFDDGSMVLSAIHDNGSDATYETIPGTDFGTAVRVQIAPLKPGDSRRLGMGFRTRIPHRFGDFGEYDQQLTLLGGWYPYLANLGTDGKWKLDQPPPVADFQTKLTPETPMQLALNGQFFATSRPIRAAVPGVQFLSLIAAPRLLEATRQVGYTEVSLLLRPKHFAIRLVPGPDEAMLVMDAAESILANQPPGTPPPPAKLMLIEAPLRLHLIEPAEGMVVISDRLYKTLGPLRGFHEARLAQGIYREDLRHRLSAREPAGDYGWVSEGLGHELARRYMNTREPNRRLLTDWLDMFDWLAVVDRFEKVPKIPFIGSYFESVPAVDPVRDRPTTFNGPRPPGRVVLSKISDLVGEEAYREMIDHCISSSQPFRECAESRFPDRALGFLLDQWIAPYPAINYWIEETHFNQPDDDGFKTTVKVRRDSSREYTEPVTIRLRSVGGGHVDVRWNSQGSAAILTQSTDRRVYQAYIDPEEKLIETRRDDNAWLPRFQALIDGADLGVSSTQFGFGANLVARVYQDYRKDLALTGFYTNRGGGFAVGPRFHFGKPIDITRFRNNLHLFYSYTALDSGFEQARPGFVTKGNTAGLGLRYDYTNVFYDQNPTLQRQLRVYADWFDRSIGSDFDYVSWGYVGSLVFPVFSRRTLIGLQVVNGFTHANGNSVVPNQGRYSLGGTRSIRGIGFGDQLGRNIFVTRAELRQSIYPAFDFNLLDIVTLRRSQLRAFVDSGNVDDSAGRIYDPSHWAVGVGVGLGVAYDAVGFLPAVAFIEVATRVDKSAAIGDVQVLFGTKQAF